MMQELPPEGPYDVSVSGAPAYEAATALDAVLTFAARVDAIAVEFESDLPTALLLITTVDGGPYACAVRWWTP